MRRDYLKKIIISSLIIVSVFLATKFVLAQDFGSAEIEAGLEQSLSATDPRQIVGRIINIVLGVLGSLALGLMIYSGFLWMSSGGNADQVSKAKKTLFNAAIGLAIILASWGITTFVLNRLYGATSGQGSGTIVCVEGDSRPCGSCGGTMYCVNNSWSACLGNDCSNPYNPPAPQTCDGSEAPGCQANSDICDANAYCNEDCLCVPRGVAGDSCSLDVSGDTCQASDDLCGDYLSCDVDSCTCYGPPVIQSISPSGGFCQDDINQSCQADSDCAGSCNLGTPNGAVGNLITINGSSFGEYHEDLSQVVFANNRTGLNPKYLNPVCVNTWTENQIIISVPPNAVTGEVRVIRADGLEDSTANDFGPKIPDFVVNGIVRPGLCAITPNQGLLGDEFSYQGINLYNGKAYFGNYRNNVEALSSDFGHASGHSGQATLPNINNGLVDTFVRSFAGNNQESSNYLRLTKEANPRDGPYLVSFSPEVGAPGQYVTIFGSGFGATRGNSEVYFGNERADYEFPLVCANSVWDNNKVVVKVPEGATDGANFIRMDIGSFSIDSSSLNPNIFTIDSQAALNSSICKLEPSSGTINSKVKLFGEYFGDAGKEVTVRFFNNRNTSGEVKKENLADTVEVRVPAESQTGPVRVIKSNQWGNELNYNVSSCTSNDDCLGQVCCPSNSYQAGRCVNSLGDCMTSIPTSVFEWDFSTKYKVDSSEVDECNLNLDLESCQESSASCCFDEETQICRSGSGLALSDNPNHPDYGYCGYYSCSVDDPNICAVDGLGRTGFFTDVDTCKAECQVEDPCGDYSGSLESCSAKSSCCLDDTTDQCRTGRQVSSGYCAEPSRPDDPFDNPVNKACRQDSDCGDVNIFGCGSDLVCHYRPRVTTNSPDSGENNVCRNVALRVGFDQLMDITSFSEDNVLLLEEMDFGTSYCPVGTIAYQFESSAKPGVIKRVVAKLLAGVKSLFSGDIFRSERVYADLPNPDRLYCQTDIRVDVELSGETSALNVLPSRLLNPDAKYYLVIKGDEQLNSQTGVMSFPSVGFNGEGLWSGGATTEGEYLKFNLSSYINSHIVQFRTLSDKQSNSGVCEIDSVQVLPDSYLFTTTDNSISENDDNPQDKTFDTASDRDKVFSAWAYSKDGRQIQPVTGYYWLWDFSLTNSEIVELESIPGLSPNRTMIKALPGVTDGETKLRASVNMSNFLGGNANSNPVCVCSDEYCSSRCLNTFSVGDGFYGHSSIYVFTCNNPWPAVKQDGTWDPWVDTCDGVSSSGACSLYNYKFYYCRDSGQPGTHDDLPAIASDAVILGQGSTLQCSIGGQACQGVNTPCGPDRNGDGNPDGICIWNVLKEAYFFREDITGPAELTNVLDLGTDGKVMLYWRSSSSAVDSYNIYYSETGKVMNQSINVSPSQANCDLSDDTYYCQLELGGLTNNVNYQFRISVLTSARAESALSNGYIAMPTDKIPPLTPANISFDDSDGVLLLVTWEKNDESADYYKLYRGVSPGRYGEFISSKKGDLGLAVNITSLNKGNNYFALSAVDAYGNESTRSAELVYVLE